MSATNKGPWVSLAMLGALGALDPGSNPGGPILFFYLLSNLSSLFEKLIESSLNSSSLP